MSAQFLSSAPCVAYGIALTSRIDAVVLTLLMGCMALIDMAAEDQLTREGGHIYHAA